MSDQSNSLHDDISYVRQMAEKGRRGPLLGGAFLAAAGLIYGAASFIQWGIETGTLPIARSSSNILWIGASVLFALVWVILIRRLRSSGTQAPGVAQYAFGMAWGACGLGIVVLLIAIGLASDKLHEPGLYNLNELSVFAFYGAAWCVSAALARQGWMFLVAAACFAITLLLGFVVGTANEIVVMGIGLLLTLCAPGLKLMSQASR